VTMASDTPSSVTSSPGSTARASAAARPDSTVIRVGKPSDLTSAAGGPICLACRAGG
jgi:hypothetical protein